MCIYHEPPNQSSRYLYDADILERGDSIEIECVLGSTWLICNSQTKEVLIRYTVTK